jgi:hypothetical protein
MKLAEKNILEYDDPIIERVFETIEKGGLPKDVKLLVKEKSEDSDGDPMWWIWISIDDDPNPSVKKIRTLSEFSNKLREKLTKAGVKARTEVRFSHYKPRLKRNVTG